MKPVRSISLYFALTLLAVGASTDASASSDVYYSAAACMPGYAGAFHDSGAEGFAWDTRGGWYNKDNNTDEWLICPVPYEREADKFTWLISVRVVVDDRHSEKNVGVQLCRQPGEEVAECPLELANNGTGEPGFLGKKTVDVAIRPGSETRWVWLKIRVPDVDSQTGVSGVLGYRVWREVER
jgi:hypothetical protein